VTATAARIVGLAPASVGEPVGQQEMFDAFYRELYKDVPEAESLFLNTQVRERHMAWPPHKNYADGFPSMRERMAAWEEHAFAMGRDSVAAVFDGAAGTVSPADVGSYTFVSCTGYAGPTPEMLLAKEFGLRQDLRRTFVGHMGCYAAFNGIKVALDSLTARPDELAMVTCAEVCSVHLRPEVTKEQVVVHGLFGDAAATVLLAAADADEPPETSGPLVLGTHTETHPESFRAMTWKVMDDAFRMTLSPYVPLYLSETIGPFVQRLLEPRGLSTEDISYWGIHPGGPKIIDFIGERLGLPAEVLRPSLDVLGSRGNCSSPTVLLILDHLMRDLRPAPGEYGVFMAFGPGLTMESALIRF
jgi:predicted naringenin-chalcone synthase